MTYTVQGTDYRYCPYVSLLKPLLLECSSGLCFHISFKIDSLLSVGEGDSSLDAPRSEFRGVRVHPAVMGLDAGFKVRIQ